MIFIVFLKNANGTHIVVYIWRTSLACVCIYLVVTMSSVIDIVIYMVCKSTFLASRAIYTITPVIPMVIGITIILISVIIL